MLDFLLVLGQVPGTHFYLTFTEIFSVYVISIASYIIRREYIIRTTFYSDMKLNYAMYSSRVRPGRVSLREVLPDYIDLAPLVDIDSEKLLQYSQEFLRQARLAGERILQRGYSLLHPTNGAF
jgi:hypothetical protein